MTVRETLLTPLRSSYRRVLRTSFYRAALQISDLGVAALRKPKRWERRSGVVVLAPPGSGNIGDVAMVEALLDHVEEPVVLVVQAADSFPDLAAHPQIADLLVLRRFIRGLPLYRAVDCWRLANRLRSARRLYVVGADLMDGTYNVTASLSRISALAVGHRLGAEAVAVGFSYATEPVASVTTALSGVQDKAVLCVRDPQSRARLARFSVEETLLTSDIVFLQELAEPPVEGKTNPTLSHDYAVVNVSGLIQHRFSSQVHEYRAVVEALHQRGLSIVFLPHVLTATRSDLGACEQVFNLYGSSSDVLIRRRLRPAEVRGLARDAAIVISGRMHLSVMALGQGRCAVTIATQGKVAGLYEHFGLEGEGLVVDPVVGFGDVIAGRIAEGVEVGVQALIRRNLPEVRRKAALNLRPPSAR